MKLKMLMALLGLQVAYLLGTTAVQELTLAHGQSVLLETRPVDPRDLLRGDYIILNYKISDVPLAAFSPATRGPLPPRCTVYVLLEPRGAFYEAIRASTDRLVPSGDQVVLKGRSVYGWTGPSQGSLRVEYGLERFYVPEGTGRPPGKITVQVSVPRSGQGVIRQVFIDGKPYAQAMRER